MAIGTTEWVVIIAVIVLLFGASAIPKIARSLGQAKGEFQRAKDDFDTEMKRAEGCQHTKASEEQIRRTAREMGIEEEGRDLDAVKKDLQEKLA